MFKPRYIALWPIKAFAWLLLAVALLVSSIYIPVFQHFIINTALRAVNSSPDIHVEVSDASLRFPMTIHAENVKVFQKGDTTLLASDAFVKIGLMPLITGEVDVRKVAFEKVMLKIGHRDSAMWMRGNVDKLSLDPTKIDVVKRSIAVDALTLRGGRVDMIINQDTTPPSPPSTVDWRIAINNIELSEVDVDLRMLPAFESITASVPNISVNNANINLQDHKIKISSVDIDGLMAKLITPADPLPSLPTVENPYQSVPMDISIDHVGITGQQIIYGKSGFTPRAGLDMDYLAMSDLSIKLDSIHNCGSDISLAINQIAMINDTSGVRVNVEGDVAMDSSAVHVDNMAITTDFSTIDISALIGIGDIKAADMPVDAAISAEIATADLQKLFPQMNSIVEQMPKNRPIIISALASGSMQEIDIEKIEANIPKYMHLLISGDIANVNDASSMNGKVKIQGNVANADPLEKAINGSSRKKSVTIPPLNLDGNVDFNGDRITGILKAVTGHGDLALDAKWINKAEGYNVNLTTRDFPIKSFLPDLGVGNVTVDISAHGHGLDPMNQGTQLVAKIDAAKVVWQRSAITNVSIGASIADGLANIKMNSANAIINADISASGNLSGNCYDWTILSDVARLDMQALGLSDTLMNAMTQMKAHANYDKISKAINADLDVAMIDLELGKNRIATRNLLAHFQSNDSLTKALVNNGDFNLDFSSPESLDSISYKLTQVSAQLGRQIKAHKAEIEELQSLLPKMQLNVVAGTNNIVNDYLSNAGMWFDSLKLKVDNDTTLNIFGNVKEFASGDLRIDDLKIYIDQQSGQIRYNAIIDNQPGTMDDFAHVKISGNLMDDRLSAMIEQRDIKGNTGYNLGAIVAISDSTLRLTIEPENPVIGYMPWTVNKGNFIEVHTNERHIDANLEMSSGNSLIHIFTEHDQAKYLETDNHQEDINVDIKGIKIEEWISVNPFAPPIKGDIAADMKVALSEQMITGKGVVKLADFTYGKTRVGSFDLDADVSTTPTGVLFAKAALKVDGKKVLEANGNLNDSLSATPMMLDLNLTHLPLHLANAFVGTETGTLDGYLNGTMDVTGSMSEPKFNGWLQFDSAAVNLTMLGSQLRFSDNKIAMDSNVIKFDNFAIYGVNNNPLIVNGNIDARHISDIRLDFNLNANDMQLVGGKRKKNADMYGNLYINLDANAHGNLRYVRATADLIVLPGTNITYVIPGGVETISSRSSNDMVKFVNFADTAAVEKADSISPTGMAVNLDAILHIAQGSTIGVDLSNDGVNKLQIQSNGTLDLSMDYMGDTRLSGRLNINKGFFKYSPPLISNLNFDFVDGSYVTFNGQMLNPTLNVHLDEKVKANVTTQGQNSRLINFIVSLGVTGTLQNMNVAFDLSTSDDITVANELQTMSAEQRANQAMNLLLYGTYTGAGTKASANLSGNPLYSFLESQLNNWMARNVKAVDISFGFDQYDRTDDGAVSSTTSYSYKVSKSFLNDRFKIVVGGNYTTDADPDENLSQNLISDISFEYMLNRSGSMYLRLFRHTGYESILEGEITQTGVGFVYRRKLRTLKDMFRWIKPNANPSVATPATKYSQSSSADETNTDK